MKKRIIIVIFSLAITSYLVHGVGSSYSPKKKPAPLIQYFEKIEHWEPVRDIVLDATVMNSLKLDDYLFRYYRKGKDTLSLYIGYYLETNKIGASHDPLVCFPGQGWIVTNHGKGKYIFDPSRKLQINYSTMVVSKGEEKEFIIYWFQSNDRSAADTLTQKIDSFMQKMAGNPEDNAFVRVSINMGQKSQEECLKIGLDFISSFYPKLLSYV